MPRVCRGLYWGSAVGRLDGAIAHAGVLHVADLLDLPKEDVDRTPWSSQNRMLTIGSPLRFLECVVRITVLPHEDAVRMMHQSKEMIIQQ